MNRGPWPYLAVSLLLLVCFAPGGVAQEAKGTPRKDSKNGGPGGPPGGGGQGPPPAVVVLGKARAGTVAPHSEFVGTFYFPEVSEVSSEVSGRVEEVSFEEGDRVREGEPLVRLDREILEKTLAGARASREQNQAELEKARKDFRRFESLYRQESVAESVYDENRFRALSLERKADSLQAEVERLEAELARKTIHAPFGGIIVEKKVDRGEWLSPGTVVGILARDDTMDAVVEVPGDILRYLTPGLSLPVRGGGGEMEGKVIAVVPRGEVATRTFPVKIRVPNRLRLVEGMEARVDVPTGRKGRALLVSRDALVPQGEQMAVFTVEGGAAKMIPVRVLRYLGAEVAVEGEGLSPGTPVVVKGNERLRPGQPVATGGGQT